MSIIPENVIVGNNDVIPGLQDGSNKKKKLHTGF
jgi:hypothetical protein